VKDLGDIIIKTDQKNDAAKEDNRNGYF